MPVALLAATTAAFLFFDRDAHSASDTLRPFLITMAPVWLIVSLAVHRLTHDQEVPSSAAIGTDDRREVR
jgi:hypothetical protein